MRSSRSTCTKAPIAGSSTNMSTPLPMVKVNTVEGP